MNHRHHHPRYRSSSIATILCAHDLWSRHYTIRPTTIFAGQLNTTGFCRAVASVRKAECTHVCTCLLHIGSSLAGQHHAAQQHVHLMRMHVHSIMLGLPGPCTEVVLSFQ